MAKKHESKYHIVYGIMRRSMLFAIVIRIKEGATTKMTTPVSRSVSFCWSH
jgi:hypothetical protein